MAGEPATWSSMAPPGRSSSGRRSSIPGSTSAASSAERRRASSAAGLDTTPGCWTMIVPMETTAWRLYSCDDHLDLWNLPRDVWGDRLPARLRGRAPRVLEAGVGAWWTCDGSVIGMYGLQGPMKGYSAISRAGIEDDGLRASNPKLRLEDMDRDGVWASVVYGPNLFGLPIQDPELKAASLAAYNDWAAIFNQYDPARLSVLPVLPTHAPDTAAAGVGRVGGRAGARRWCGPSGGDQQPVRVRVERPGLGALLGRRRGGWAPGELPHRPGNVAGAGRAWKLGAGRILGGGPHAARRAARHDGLLRSARAASEVAPRARRVRDRMASVLRQPTRRSGRETPRQGAGLSHPREAERALPAPGLRDLRGGAARSPAAAAARSRQLHVGLGLSTPRQHVPAFAGGHRARVRGPRRRLRLAREGVELQGAVRVRLSRDDDARPRRDRGGAQRRHAAVAQSARPDYPRGDHRRRAGVHERGRGDRPHAHRRHHAHRCRRCRALPGRLAPGGPSATGCHPLLHGRHRRGPPPAPPPPPPPPRPPRPA